MANLPTNHVKGLPILADDINAIAAAVNTLTAAVAALGGIPDPTPTQASGFIGYLQTIPGLIHYYPLNDTFQAQDVIGNADGTVHGTVSFTSGGAVFSGGAGNYISIPDRDDFSLVNQASHGMSIYHGMAVSDWNSTSNLRPDGFAHYMGKGQANQHEYTFRYYPGSGAAGAPGYDSTRLKRTSAYHYSIGGDKGTGSYVQNNPANNEEQVLCAGYDTTTTTNPNFPQANGFGSTYPGGTFMWKNGVEIDADGFTSGGGGTNIVPADGSAPFTIGCRNDQDSWMKGRIRRVMIFNRKLTTAEVKGIYDNWGKAEGTPVT